MFCLKCHSGISQEDEFCTQCGTVVTENETSCVKQKVNPDEKWWQRLFKVLYILAYIPLLIIIPAVWISNHGFYYQNEEYGSYLQALGASVLTLIIYFAIIRLIKIAILYVVAAEKPQWKKEFKKLF